jgi:hypothetical protein
VPLKTTWFARREISVAAGGVSTGLHRDLEDFARHLRRVAAHRSQEIGALQRSTLEPESFFLLRLAEFFRKISE